MEASHSCCLTGATVLPVTEKSLVFTGMKLFERLPLSVWTIQQTLLIAFAGDLIEAEPLAILYPTVPGLLALSPIV